jgi:organic radical activating enzyme
MSYAVKELFLTLQGEGLNAGRPAVFLRFAGCNLWSGREADRDRGAGSCARWCDTDFVGTDGPGGGRFADAEALGREARRIWEQGGAGARGALSRGASGAGEGPPDQAPTPSSEAPRDNALVVCTGGEPLLQLDEALVTALHAQGFSIAIETNGTLPVPAGIDWICVSPKAGAELVVTRGDELKLIFPQAGAEPTRYEALAFRHFLLQPLDDPHRVANTEAAIAYCLAHPSWRLSLQTHKLIGIR